MKLKNFLAMMAIALCAVACSDDDNKKEDTVIPAQEVAGTYNGTLSLSVSGNDQGTSDSQVKITAEEGGTVQVLLVAGEGMMSLPDIAIPGIKVHTSDNVTYILPESAVDVTVGSVKYTGSLQGTIKDEKADLIFTLKPGAMPMAITATFVGTK